MVRDHVYYHAKLREAERMRSEAIAKAFVAAWTGASRLVTGAYRSVDGLLRQNRPAHH